MYDYQESITAKLCAFVRAYHSLYGQPKIFDDSFAYDLMGQHEFLQMAKLIENNFDLKKTLKDFLNSSNYVTFNKALIEKTVTKLLSAIPLVRIAYTEAQLQKLYQKAIANQSSQDSLLQYVILGAGLDTFAFRNDKSDLQIYELDHLNTGMYKIKRLTQLRKVIPQNLHFVGINFNTDNLLEVMQGTTFKKDVLSFVSLLGVTYYLTASVFEDTVSKLEKLLSIGSYFVFDYPSALSKNAYENADHRIDSKAYQYDLNLVKKLSSMTKDLGEQMAKEFSFDEIKDILKRHHFEVLDHRCPQAIQQDLLNQGSSLKAFPNVHLVTAIKTK